MPNKPTTTNSPRTPAPHIPAATAAPPPPHPLKTARTTTAPGNNPLIEIKNLNFSFGTRPVLKNANLSVVGNDFIAIIGPNGSGKSTLVELMLGLHRPQQGTVSLHLPRESIGYLPQYYTSDPTFPATVAELLACYTTRPHSLDPHILAVTNIASLLSEPFVNLSRGQQQRVLIAAALSRNPRLLILDEPTGGVDLSIKNSFNQLLQKLNADGVAIIIVTHEVGVLPPMVKHVLCIHNCLCCWSAPDQLPQVLSALYGPHIIHHHDLTATTHDHHHPHPDTHDA